MAPVWAIRAWATPALAPALAIRVLAWATRATVPASGTVATGLPTALALASVASAPRTAWATAGRTAPGIRVRAMGCTATAAAPMATGSAADSPTARQPRRLTLSPRTGQGNRSSGGPTGPPLLLLPPPYRTADRGDEYPGSEAAPQTAA